jgi:surfactin synthase thioesterase subunit
MALTGYIIPSKANSSNKPLPLVLLGHSYLGAILALELAKASFRGNMYMNVCVNIYAR